jgi:hypothetical protein
MRPLATIGAATILAGIAWIAYGMMSGDSGPEEACRTASPFYIGGIQVNEPDHRHWVDTLDEIGMNTVAVTVYAPTGHGTTRSCGSPTPSPASSTRFAPREPEDSPSCSCYASLSIMAVRATSSFGTA